jgi:carbonic anhydrase
LHERIPFLPHFAVDISGGPLHVNGGGLPGIYVVEQFHFHWGSEKDVGSEHELNGYYYPMEVSKTELCMKGYHFSHIKGK